MKKSLVAILLLLCLCFTAVASAETYKVTNLDEPFSTEIGSVTVTRAKLLDYYPHYDEKSKGSASAGYTTSGNEKDFYILYVDITNVSNKAINYGDNVTIKMVFNNQFEFYGEYRQVDTDRKDSWAKVNGKREDFQSKEAVIPRDAEFDIDPWYTGHYAFICEIPNAVVYSSDPLTMVVNISGTELTYSFR